MPDHPSTPLNILLLLVAFAHAAARWIGYWTTSLRLERVNEYQVLLAAALTAVFSCLISGLRRREATPGGRRVTGTRPFGALVASAGLILAASWLVASVFLDPLLRWALRWIPA